MVSLARDATSNDGRDPRWAARRSRAGAVDDRDGRRDTLGEGQLTAGVAAPAGWCCGLGSDAERHARTLVGEPGSFGLQLTTPDAADRGPGVVFFERATSEITNAIRKLS